MIQGGGGHLEKKTVDMISAGKRLRELRGIRTRSGVSRETEIPYSTLQSYEEGTRTPSGRNKKKLANYYGVSVESIFFAGAYNKKL